MKKIFILMLTLLTGMGAATAADRLTVEDAKVPQGGQATLTVGFHFDKANTYAAYQFNLTLPAGVSPVTDADNEIIITPAGCHDGSHMVQNSYDTETGSWIVTCLSPKGKTLTGTDGELLSLTLQADANLTVGEVLDGKVSGIVFSDAENTAYKLSEVEFCITIDSPVDPRIVLDEKSTTPPVSALKADIRVIRTIKGGEWNTIVLPFAMTAEQIKAAFGNDTQLADFLGYDTVTEMGEVVAINVQFSTVNSMEANHPYIIKTKEDKTEFTVDGVDIDPAEAIVKRGASSSKYKNFIGTYVADTEVPAEALFVNGGQFWYSTGKTKMKAYRAYFEFYQVIESGNSSRISMTFDDAEATGIAISTGTVTTDDYYYNLQGQRISQPAKGVFIKGNRKMVKN